MRFGRAIFAALMCLGLIVSLAPAGAATATTGSEPATAPGVDQDADSCCKSDAQAGERDTDRAPASPTDGKCCGGPGCVMLCCRLIPVQADTLPPLAAGVRVTIPVLTAPPATLDSLDQPEAIFHPPKA